MKYLELGTQYPSQTFTSMVKNCPKRDFHTINADMSKTNCIKNKDIVTSPIEEREQGAKKHVGDLYFYLLGAAG